MTETERISLLIPTELLSDIDLIAEKEGRNRSEQIRFFLIKLVTRRKTAAEGDKP